MAVRLLGLVRRVGKRQSVGVRGLGPCDNGTLCFSSSPSDKQVAGFPRIPTQPLPKGGTKAKPPHTNPDNSYLRNTHVGWILTVTRFIIP